jgi:phenylpyruvate tautomerase PptA (4-oxalocrotonate tautomerase family)
MPILEVQVIGRVAASARKNLPARLADVAATVLRTEPFNTWVLLKMELGSAYAENGGGPPKGVRPVIVRLLKRELPTNRALKVEVQALTKAIALVCRRPVQNVHIIYEPPARGRVAFGGELVE